MGRVEPDHIREWLASGVDPGIIALNVETLTDTATDPNADSLFPIAERLNWNIARFGQQTRSNLRGWWVSGIDPFTWERMSWGRFKPDATTPILDREKGKPAKYLSPSLGPGSSRLILLDVPFHIWEQVAQRYSIALTPQDKDKGFWHWVWQHPIPLILTEGEKKAGCLLSLGYATIALPGIFNGYRKETQQLIAELEFFATPNRQVCVCFDYESKPKVLKQVNLAIAKLGRLLARCGCCPKVIALPGPQKGVDDFVVAQGHASFDQLYTSAVELSFWQASQLWALTYPPSLSLNQRYLEALPFPDSGIVCIRSPKGTGKTAALEPLIQAATRQGRRVLVLTHRIQLGRAICNRLGLDWIEEVRSSETQGLFGFGLCIDSLHPHSQARFDPQSWQGAILILDECEQVIWHALNSATCYEQRISILATFKALVQVVLSTGGLIIAQDADLSDLSIDYLKGLAESAVEPWVVLNQWQPAVGWQVHCYDTPNPAPILARMEQVISTGAVFVALDSQKVKGKWSSKNLETYLQGKFPHKRILRIDSESVADPQHPAYGIVERINAVIQNYDIVLATPTIGTGISIDVRGHFQAVFGIFQGATPDAESRQALARVRETVPRFVWAAPFGPGKIGNGSCHYQDVATSTTKGIKYNIALLKEIDFDLDAQSDPITLRTWARMAARVNTSMWNYRQELRRGLETEGHQVAIVTADLSQLLPPDILNLCTELSDLVGKEAIAQALLQDLSRGILQFPGYEYLGWQHDPVSCELVETRIGAVRDQNKQQEAIAVASAPEITVSEYETLKDQRAKTPEERQVERKHELQRRYPTAITPELKLKDDEGWYSKLRLHYYLTHDPEFVRLRDLKEWQGHLDRGAGKVAPQDVRLLTAQVEALRGLSLLSLLDSNREVRATDADVEQLTRYCIQFGTDIKTLFGLTITPKMKPIEVVQALLSKLDIKLACIGRDVAADGRRGGLRVYQYQPATDGRAAIFEQWQQRDSLMLQEERATQADSHQLTEPGAPDPPLDIYKVKQSPGGSEPAKLVSQEKEQVSLLVKIAVEHVIHAAKQVSHWGVRQVESVRAQMRQLQESLVRLTQPETTLTG